MLNPTPQTIDQEALLAWAQKKLGYARSYDPDEYDYSAADMLPLNALIALLSAPAETQDSAKLREALGTVRQALHEVRGAQAVGANWYTKGASGLHQQVRMWLDKAFAALPVLEEALASTPAPAQQPTQKGNAL